MNKRLFGTTSLIVVDGGEGGFMNSPIVVGVIQFNPLQALPSLKMLLGLMP